MLANRRPAARCIRVLGLGLLCASACTSEDDADGADSTDTDAATETDEYIDEAGTIERALEYSEWMRINDEARPSQHALGETVNIWVPAAHADLYRAIDPELASLEGVFPEGAVVVKEHLDAQGSPVSLTVMAKAAPGYDADSGDWWWALIGIDGEPMETGKVSWCISCHQPRSGTDYLYGVPLDNRP